jgi:uncharacterized membrane protein YjfL (UPF0719 family)
MIQATDQAYSFVQTFNDVILFPTIALLSAIALLVFMFGCFLYIVRAADPAARAQGVKHITWGIVGMVVMLSAYTIMSIFAGTFGLNDELNDARDGNVVFPIENFLDTVDTGDSDTVDTGNSGLDT